jgi:hypothetical protein
MEKKLTVYDALAMRVGFWSSVAGIVLEVGYMGILLICLAVSGGFQLTEPYESLVAVDVLLTAAVLPVFFAAIHFYASPEKKVLSLIALVFTAIFSGMTATNRFVQLTVVRQSILMGKSQGLDLILPYQWPSVMMALELLGWGFFLGLAMLFAGPVFSGGKVERWLKWTLIISGILSLISCGGLLTGYLVILPVGFIAWGPGLAAAVVLAAILFQRRLLE